MHKQKDTVYVYSDSLEIYGSLVDHSVMYIQFFHYFVIVVDDVFQSYSFTYIQFTRAVIKVKPGLNNPPLIVD